jgi:repressor LexA
VLRCDVFRVTLSLKTSLFRCSRNQRHGSYQPTEGQKGRTARKNNLASQPIDTVCLYGIFGEMAASLTNTQAKVLAFVEQFSAQIGHPPTMKEVARHFGWSSTSTAQQHLEALEKKGRLTRTPKSPRSLRVTKPFREVRSNQTVAVPLVGKIAAGSPTFALEEAEEILPLPRALFHGTSLFALRVKGDSMVNAGIFDGDIAILRSGPDFSDGDIAAVVVDEEATLKRAFKTKRGVRLHAENPAYPDRLVPSEQIKESFRLAGVLVGTIRRFI